MLLIVPSIRSLDQPCFSIVALLELCERPWAGEFIENYQSPRTFRAVPSCSENFLTIHFVQHSCLIAFVDWFYGFWLRTLGFVHTKPSILRNEADDRQYKLVGKPFRSLQLILVPRHFWRFTSCLLFDVWFIGQFWVARYCSTTCFSGMMPRFMRHLSVNYPDRRHFCVKCSVNFYKRSQSIWRRIRTLIQPFGDGSGPWSNHLATDPPGWRRILRGGDGSSGVATLFPPY